MKPGYHAAVSAVSAAGVYWISGSPLLAALNFSSGVFIDIDHIPEYFLLHDRSLSIKKFLGSQMHMSANKTYLLLHGIDLALLILAVGFFTGYVMMGAAISAGMIFHLVLDTVFNPVKTPFGMFLTFRIFHRFETEKIYNRIPC